MNFFLLSFVFSFLCGLVLSQNDDDASSTTTSSTTTQPPFKPVTSVVQIKTWDATYPPVERCRQGLMGAIAIALGADPSKLGFLSGLLGGLGGSPAAYAQHLQSYSYDRYIEEAARKASHNGVEAQERAIREAQAKHMLHSSMFGNTSSLLAAARSISPEALLHLFSKHIDLSDYPEELASSLTASRRRLGLMDMIPEQTLLYLTSKTFGHLLTFLFGPSTSTSGEPVLTSPMINLVEGMCKTAELSDEFDVSSHKRSCALVNVLYSAFACRGEVLTGYTNDMTVPKPATCQPQHGRYRDTVVNTTNFIDIRLKDIVKLNNGELPEFVSSNVIDEEGFDLYWLYRSTAVGTIFSEQSLKGVEEPVEDIIPGWQTVGIIRASMEGEPAFSRDTTIEQSSSVILVARPRVRESDDLKCKVVMSIRPTQFDFEWKLNLQTQTVPFLDDKIRAHSGFAAIALSTLPAANAMIDDMLEECSQLDLIVTGHSFGAGLSQVLALAISRTFKSSVHLSTANFAPPIVFNEAGVEAFKTINARNIAFDMDPIAAAPCQAKNNPRTGMIRCDSELGMIDSGVGTDYYTMNRGRHIMKIMDVYNKPGYDEIFDRWGVFKMEGMVSIRISLKIPAPVQVFVSHLCGYNCKFSEYCSTKLEDTWDCSGCAGVFGGIDTLVNLQNLMG